MTRTAAILFFVVSVLAGFSASAQENRSVLELKTMAKTAKSDTTLKLVMVHQKKGLQLLARVDAKGRIIITEEHHLEVGKSSYIKCFFDGLYPYCIETSETWHSGNKSTIPEDAYFYFDEGKMIGKQGTTHLHKDSLALLRTASVQYRKAQKRLLKNPFKTLVYDEVVVYPMYGEGFYGQEAYLEHIDQKKGKVLDEKQVRIINQLVTDTSSFKGETASCFNPHMLLVYYKDKKVLGTIAVCLDCNRLEGTGAIDLPATRFNPNVNPERACTTCFGLTPAARAILNDLCIKLGHRHCAFIKDPLFDDEPVRD